MNESQNISSISSLMNTDQVVLLDGAMGTELSRRGIDTSLPLWSAKALETDPLIVQSIHRDYTEAGSNVITANTFRTTRFTYQQAGLDALEAGRRARNATLEAVAMALEASGGKALVAGSMAPVADCYTPSDYPGRTIAESIYTELSSSLLEAGAHLLLLETHITFEEVQIALQNARKTGLPVWVSFLINREICLWDGTPLGKAVDMAENEGAQAALINCVTLDIAQKGVTELSEAASLPFGIYANAGQSQPATDGTISELVSDAHFVEAAQSWVAAGARIIGGCCGTTPMTISKLRTALYPQSDWHV